MSESDSRTEEEYKEAQKIMRILIDSGLISGSSGIEEYMNTWEAVFKILDLTKQR
jgi:hypothetical protein